MNKEKIVISADEFRELNQAVHNVSRLILSYCKEKQSIFEKDFDKIDAIMAEFHRRFDD